MTRLADHKYFTDQIRNLWEIETLRILEHKLVFQSLCEKEIKPATFVERVKLWFYRWRIHLGELIAGRSFEDS